MAASSRALPAHRLHAVGLLRLVRLSNALPAGVLVLIGAELAGGRPIPGRGWLAAAAMCCITAFGYTSNDLCDVAEDRINKPDRPLPSGRVSPAAARLLAAGLAISALALSAPLGLIPLTAAAGALALLVLYNRRLKSSAGAGNALVALLAGATLVTGSVAIGGLTLPALKPVWAPAALLAAFIAARELLKTVEDRAGDVAAGRMTATARWGTRGVLCAVAGLAGLVALLSLLPALRQGYSLAYLALISVGVTLPLAASVVYLWGGADAVRTGRCLAVLKGSYFMGILALLLR